MSDYRRVFIKGGTYFFTVVTYNRLPIFEKTTSIDLLKQCFRTVLSSHPFRIDAIVILPDHMHTIWTLPASESDFSTRWKLIKWNFSHNYSGEEIEAITSSMLKKHEKGIWQRRFWEHAIRDEEDFDRHCDYIHYNPVKHGYVSSPIEWKYSSFKSLVEKGFYPVNWGGQIDKELIDTDYE
jgi:putative transposase